MPDFDALADIALRHGARIGVTDTSPFPQVEAEIRQRNESGAAGSLGFTYRSPSVSTAPVVSFPWATSIVVVAVPYLDEGDGVGGPDEASGSRSVARFADRDRYDGLRRVLDELARVIEESGHRCEVLYDDDRLVDRAVAVRAGIAWWGKSTMVLAPGLGPWFLIGSVVTDARYLPTEPMTRSCGTCSACIPACPTGAIVEPGVLDARRCLAAIFQSRGAIPVEVRHAAGGRVYGCDECLVACPPGDAALNALHAAPTVDPSEVLRLSDVELDSRFAHWYVPSRNMRFIRRNALVAVGNLGRSDDVNLVAGYLGHPDPLLRQHAAWALRTIGGDRCERILASALLAESDSGVRSELIGDRA